MMHALCTAQKTTRMWGSFPHSETSALSGRPRRVHTHTTNLGPPVQVQSRGPPSSGADGCADGSTPSLTLWRVTPLTGHPDRRTAGSHCTAVFSEHNSVDSIPRYSSPKAASWTRRDAAATVGFGYAHDEHADRTTTCSPVENRMYCNNRAAVRGAPPAAGS
jgi:hypothetical protein